jgi:hypothetical protein
VIREDYIMRLIRQLIDAIARIAGFRKRGEYDRALQEVARAWDDLGVPRELVLATDRETLLSLLREPAKQRIAAELLAEEAHVVQAKGDPLHAAALRRRAIELFASARDAEPTADDDGAIAELARHLPPSVVTDTLRRDTE